ncbi:putative circularly permuted ATP-grasp superfamily protein [Blastococcus colisei]|uniref:Putative circularly permuted ATP-grasp superfamily protein n=1 Tax=Blastococcus colisei TaxID=1564162 RepID=A0A543P0Y4_9ACTN|nr:circularly permuted type 2 ATP-grasp protein [Blastococcus colisei]TQN37630.1 putative circularly permuted ATP-grasp superfamily protein [Blastococcus colisei]
MSRSGDADPFAGYPAAPADEAVSPDGRLRDGYAGIGSFLQRLGTPGLTAAATALAAEGAARGIAVATWSDGRQDVRPFPLDPVPRILPAAEWARIAAGVEQRHRALNAFLADAYRAAGRRRGDVDRDPQVVRAGVLPQWAVAHSPVRDPGAVGQAWPGQRRATVAGADVQRTASGEWVVTADHLRVPAGLGYALAGRDALRGAVPELLAAATGVVDPSDALPLLRAGLATAAPPACTGTPRLAVLTAGESDNAWFEHRLFADALGAPLVRAGDLWPRTDGGVEAAVDGERLPIDVLYRRFDDGLLAAFRTPIGQSLDVLLTEAVRAGRLGLANVPGNELADDAASYAWVPQMIRFYLGEEPLLGSVPTWVLAHEDQWAAVRDRLHELVITPVAGYGGRGTIVGPACSAAELAFLQAEVSAAPYRFVAREPVTPTTLPTLVDGALRPRHVDLRVLSVVGPGEGTTALPAPLTRVADGPEPATWWWGGAKDTWILG